MSRTCRGHGRSGDGHIGHPVFLVDGARNIPNETMNSKRNRHERKCVDLLGHDGTQLGGEATLSGTFGR